MLKDAQRLAKAGFAIHWLHKRSKRPIGDHWSENPVLSPDKLQKTYRDGNNVGVRLGKWSKIAGHYLHVIDMDIRDPSKANESREHLSALFPDYSEWPAVASGSGGDSRHFYLLSDKPFPSKKLAHSETFAMVFDKQRGREVKKWDWEIELFGTCKQVAIPPSIHPETGKPYRWLHEFDFDALDLGDGPFVPSARLGNLTNTDDSSTEYDPERAQPLGLSIDEAREILNDLPDNHYREDRDGWLTVGMALHHEFNGSDEAYKLWCDFSRDSEKFDKKDQRRVWRSFKGKPKPVRMASLKIAVREARLNEEFENLDETDDFADTTLEESPDDEFDDLLGELPAPKQSKRETKLKKADVEVALGHVPPKVKRLNNKHAVVFINGKTAILTENSDGSVAFGTVGDLHNYYENDRVATDKATEPVTKAWMRHKLRREYPNGVIFGPGGDVKGAYNLWRGFSVEPSSEGSCRRILSHLKRVICDNNEQNYRYALGWWAHMIQKPEEKPGVAMVLRGKKGAGKDTIADYVGGLFPHNHVKIANQDQLVGKFNAHMEKCLLLHVEEGFWAGSKNAEGVLKHLITTEKMFIEPKGLNGFHVGSYMRLFMSSNEKWVVPATEDERRYFVLDVPPTRKGDHDYFQAIRNEMRNSGRAALLDYLMNYDLSDFNVRAVPDTAALGEQKVEGLKNVEKWWFGMLESGSIVGEVEGDWRLDYVRVDVNEFYDIYCGWIRSRRYQGEELNEVHFGKRLRNMVPSIERVRMRSEGLRNYRYSFPPLEQCRQEVEQFLGSEILWPDEPVSEIEEPEEPDDFDLL